MTFHCMAAIKTNVLALFAISLQVAAADTRDYALRLHAIHWTAKTLELSNFVDLIFFYLSTWCVYLLACTK